jgi:hypothetical protein
MHAGKHFAYELKALGNFACAAAGTRGQLTKLASLDADPYKELACLLPRLLVLAQTPQQNS